MTKLLRRVKRESCRANDRGRPIIITLEPGDVIGFRQKGRHKTYRLPVYSAYLLAAQAEANAARHEKLAAKKARNGGKGGTYGYVARA